MLAARGHSSRLIHTVAGGFACFRQGSGLSLNLSSNCSICMCIHTVLTLGQHQILFVDEVRRFGRRSWRSPLIRVDDWARSALWLNATTPRMT
uniref:U471e n=1 Tax=Mycobacterium leprae TaxID=1769 RepID=Q50139_MYCLR|nr:u471e [Mycobacterium leprae]